MNTYMNESQVRQIAYNIWEAEGRPSGQAERHWNMALAQTEAEDDEYAASQPFSDDGLGFGNDTSDVSASEYDLSGKYEDTSGRTRGSRGDSTYTSSSSSPSRSSQQSSDAVFPQDSDEDSSRSNQTDSKKRSRFFS